MAEYSGDIRDFVERFRNGDLRAFNEFYAKNRAKLFHYVRQYLMDRQQALDVAESAFAAIWNTRSGFKSIDHIEAYLYVSARNKAYNELRASRLEKQVDIISLESNEFEKVDLVSDHPEIFSRMVQAELMQLLVREIDALPKQRRRVMHLFYLQQLNSREIAKLLNISEDAVRKTKLQAISELRRRLAAKKIAFLLPFFLSSVFQKF